jgi:ferredoxin-NADP reductase
MRTCKAILKGRDGLCDGTIGLCFEKPDGFKFKPGQFATFTLDSSIATDADGGTRALSIASAPHEKDLMVAMRMRDTGFKRVVSVLPIGAPFFLEGPFGDLTLHKDTARPAVFLAGGIGITPFRSMIRHATEVGSAHRIFLFYSIRRIEEGAFLNELHEFQELNPRFKFIPTITQPDRAPHDWQGELGHITETMLNRLLPASQSPIFYIAGPTGMVDGMRQMLCDALVSDDDIRAEAFAGY